MSVINNLQFHRKRAFFGRAVQKPWLTAKHMFNLTEFGATASGRGAAEMRRKVFRSDETKAELFGFKARWYIWAKSKTAHQPQTLTLKYGFRLWGWFSAAGTGIPVRTDGKMNGTHYREFPNKNLLYSAKRLRVGGEVLYHHDNDAKSTAKKHRRGLKRRDFVLEFRPRSKWQSESRPRKCCPSPLPN